MAQSKKSSRISSVKRPIVGVIVGTRMLRTTGTMELAKANQEAKTTLYFFSTKDVDFSHRRIRGMYFNQTKQRWDNKYFSFPDVLYVRGGSRREVIRVIKKFDDMGIRRINPIAFFNKGELFDELSLDNDVRPYLPHTVRIDGLSEVEEFMQQHSEVYVKARRGRKGMQVMRIAKLPTGGYEYKYSILGKLVRKEVNNFENLQKAMDTFFDGRKVIAQQAIDVVRVDSTRLVDFRAEVQRDKNGEIDIVAIPIRVGRSNAPITTHSSAYEFDNYLIKLFPDYSSVNINTLKQRIFTFLTTVYKCVEKRYGMFGEIGVDFAVDKQGRIWLIECNAQSAKVSIRKAYGAKTVRRAYLNPLGYAKYIAAVSRSR